VQIITNVIRCRTDEYVLFCKTLSPTQIVPDLVVRSSDLSSRNCRISCDSDVIIGPVTNTFKDPLKQSFKTSLHIIKRGYHAISYENTGQIWRTQLCLVPNLGGKLFFSNTGRQDSLLFLSSSWCSWSVRHVSCSLILKMKLVPPSLPRSSYVSSSFWFPVVLVNPRNLMSYKLIDVIVSALGSVLCVVLWKQKVVFISFLRQQLIFGIVNVAVIYKGQINCIFNSIIQTKILCHRVCRNVVRNYIVFCCCFMAKIINISE